MEPQGLGKIGEVLGWFHRRRHAAAAGKLTGGGEGLLEVVEDVAQDRGLFEIQILGGGLHLHPQLVEDRLFAFSLEDDAGLLDFLEIVLA